MSLGLFFLFGFAGDLKFVRVIAHTDPLLDQGLSIQ